MSAEQPVIRRMNVADLVPAPYNPRTISPEAFAGLRASVHRWGIVEPIIINERTGNVVGGHQRLKVLVEDAVAETDVVVVDLSEIEERVLNVTLNSPAISGEFTDDLGALLDAIEAELPDLFAAVRLDALRVEGEQEPEPGTGGDDAPDVQAVVHSRQGEVYELGPHRLMCGDSAKAADVVRLMGGAKAAMMWTDPPYGVSYVGKTEAALTISNDGADGLDALLRAAFSAADAALADGAAIAIAHPAGALSVVFGVRFLAQGWRLHEGLVWVKDSMVLGHSDYHYRHEPILFGYKAGGGRRGRGGDGWYGDNSQTSVFEIARPLRSEEHPTMKPIGLIDPMLRNSCPPGGAVFDPFLGSGTTLMAAAQTGRVCYGMEIDPAYCDVIRRRWTRYALEHNLDPGPGALADD